MLLAGFAIWAIGLVLRVRELRTDVEMRVGWLRRLQAAQVALEDPAQRARSEDELREMLVEMASARAADEQLSESASKLEAQLGLDPTAAATQARRAAIDEVIRAVRRQTAGISERLGKEWDSLHLLVGVSLAFGALLLGLVVYLRSVLLAREQTARALVEARLRHADRVIAIGTLAAGAAHEINNPLALLKLNLSLLERRLPQDSTLELAGMLDEAKDAVDRVAQTVDDLRSFARRDDEELTDVDLADVVRQAVRLFTPSAAKRTHIEANVAEVPRVRASQRRLLQVLLNLLANANHALSKKPDAARALTVTVDATDDGKVRAIIDDSGPGISDEVLASLGAAFVTTKPVGEGTGLGLYVSRGIVSAAGGTLSLSRRPEGGTRAIVELPASNLASSSRLRRPIEAARAADDPAREEPRELPPGLRVVVIDDEATLRGVLTRILDRHQVTAFGEGAPAVKHLLAEDVDLVLCDVSMPGMDGVEVFGAVTSVRPELAARFVFMTGGALTDRGEQFIQEREGALLAKPFGRAAVLRTLALCFARARVTSSTPPRRRESGSA